jgi:hypothetical protein
MGARGDIIYQCRDLGLRRQTRLALIAAAFAPTKRDGVPTTEAVAHTAGWRMVEAYCGRARNGALLLSTYGEEDVQQKRAGKGEHIVFVAAMHYPDGHLEGAELVRIGKARLVRLVDVVLSAAYIAGTSHKRPFYAQVWGSKTNPRA